MKNLEAFLISSKDLRLECSKDSINTQLFGRLKVDQHKVCELQRSDTTLRLSSLCLPDVIIHDLNIPGFLPPFLLTASDQKPNGRKAQKQC